MAGYITYIDYLILMFIQEHLRFNWLTEPTVFISHLGNSGLFWILLCLVLLAFKRTRKMGFCGLLAPAHRSVDHQCGFEKYHRQNSSL